MSDPLFIISSVVSVAVRIKDSYAQATHNKDEIKAICERVARFVPTVEDIKTHPLISTTPSIVGPLQGVLDVFLSIESFVKTDRFHKWTLVSGAWHASEDHARLVSLQAALDSAVIDFTAAQVSFGLTHASTTPQHPFAEEEEEWQWVGGGMLV